MSNLSSDLLHDIATISKIDVIPSILKVLCHTTGMGFSAVARVTEDKWVACAVEDRINFGLEAGGELVIATTICNEIRDSREPVIFNHASKNSIYQHHHTPKHYGIESYVSVPIITRAGDFFGTLCAIDPHPAVVENEATLKMFELYADLISFHMQLLDENTASSNLLLEEKENAELREQFIAVLGHDMRNPLGAISNVAALLMKMQSDEKVMRLAGILQNSSFRMKGLIDNIMDFSQARLGGGILLNKGDVLIEELIQQVVSELKLIYPDQIFQVEIKTPKKVYLDGLRLAQLSSNLISNAITHGAAGAPILIKVQLQENFFELSIINSGQPISQAAQKRLFQPFFRGDYQTGKQEGLGLGLFICSEIAKAHGGMLTVHSDDQQTCFKLSIPIS